MRYSAQILATVLAFGDRSGAGCDRHPPPHPCSPATLDVTWSFVDAAGNAGLTCAQAGVDSVRVYVDGVQQGSPIACSGGGASFSRISSGNHQVVVEGLAGPSTLVDRDWATVNVASCGATTWAATPGRGTIQLLPNTCADPTDPLLYDLWDVTTAPNHVSYILPTVWQYPVGTFTCGGGVSVELPWANLQLQGIEETSATGVTAFNTLCSTLAMGLTHAGTTSVAFDWAPGPATYCF
jgi:hypothetical protein